MVKAGIPRSSELSSSWNVSRLDTNGRMRSEMVQSCPAQGVERCCMLFTLVKAGVPHEPETRKKRNLASSVALMSSWPVGAAGAVDSKSESEPEPDSEPEPESPPASYLTLLRIRGTVCGEGGRERTEIKGG
jgi:hypothetical protein